MGNWRDNMLMLLTFARWKWKMSRRAVYHEALHTLSGKLWIVLIIVALPSLIPLVIHGAAARILPGSGVLGGMLVAAHLALALAFVAFVPPILSKVFVVRRTPEPLMSHPSVMPLLALDRMLVSVLLLGVAYLVPFFYLFYGRALINRLESPWIGIPVHLATTSVYLLVLGIAVASVCRSWTRRPNIARRARIVLRGGAAVFFGAFFLLTAGVTSMVERAPERLAALGEMAQRALHFGLAPLGATLAIDEGRWLTLLGWIVALGLATWLALRAATAWAAVAHLELPIDLAASTRRRYSSLFDGLRAGRGRWPAVRPFWRKDVVAPYAREPRSYFGEQWFAFSAGVGAVVLIAVLRNRSALQPVHSAALLVVVLLGVVAGLAMLRGLNCLGLEGSQLGLLRPVLTGGQLFVRKGLANGIYVLTHAVAHALVLFAAAQIAGLRQITLIAVLVYAIGGALIWTFAASALGFLLPDLQRRATFLSGATTVAKYLYLGTCAMSLSLVGVAHVQCGLGRMDGGSYAGLITLVVLTLVAAFFAVTWWALHRFPRIEL
jgi:hypothetical protein